jgi:nicotinate-nucleotide adenylyltransferase
LSIGILGGSFDPIHIGHLVLAEEIRKHHQLQKIIFVPARKSPRLEKKNATAAHHRWNMTKLAIDDNPFFEVSAIEMERSGISYTFDTLQEIAKEKAPTPINFIIGSDNLVDLLSWYKWKEILATCPILVGSRPGYCKKDIWQFEHKVGLSLCQKLWNNCVTIPLIDISSSMIRNFYQMQRSDIRYLIPESVNQYILKNNLYAK